MCSMAQYREDGPLYPSAPLVDDRRTCRAYALRPTLVAPNPQSHPHPSASHLQPPPSAAAPTVVPTVVNSTAPAPVSASSATTLPTTAPSTAPSSATTTATATSAPTALPPLPLHGVPLHPYAHSYPQPPPPHLRKRHALVHTQTHTQHHYQHQQLMQFEQQPPAPPPPPAPRPTTYTYTHGYVPSPRLAEPGATYFIGPFSKEHYTSHISKVLDQLADFNNAYVALPTYSQPESVFFSVSRPEIPTKDYVRRLVTYTRCSPAAFLVMLIYMDRIANANPRLRVTPFNMHRLLVTALTLACKFLDDRCYSNIHYAKVGGIPTAREMNRLELQFLKYLDYRLHVTPEQYYMRLGALIDRSPPTTPPSMMQFLSTSPVSSVASSPAPPSIPTPPPSSQQPRVPERLPAAPVQRVLEFGPKHTTFSPMVDNSPNVNSSRVESTTALSSSHTAAYPMVAATASPYGAAHAAHHYRIRHSMSRNVRQDRWSWKAPIPPHQQAAPHSGMHRAVQRNSSRKDNGGGAPGVGACQNAVIASMHSRRLYSAPQVAP